MLKLRTGTHRDLERYYTLFEIDFDRRELLSKISLHKSMLKNESELLIAYDDETKIDLVYAMVFTKNIYKYVLLKYYAVLPWYREKGVGSDAMQLIAQRYSERQGIVAEIPCFESNDITQIRDLKNFFKKHGYTETNADYYIGGAETSLLVKKIKATAEFLPIYQGVMKDFYSRILPAGSEMIDYGKNK